MFPSTAKLGRVVGPVLPYDNARNINNPYDPRTFYRNGGVPQAGSPHYLRTHASILEKTLPETHRVLPQGKHQLPSQQRNVPTRSAIDVNTNPYHQPAKIDHLNDSCPTIDAKLLQAQSQFGAVGAAAVAIAAHRHSGAIQYGLS